MTTWVITGGDGMLGTDLVRRVREAGHDVRPLTIEDVDIRDPQSCLDALAGADVVVNTAAYTAVDKAEEDEATAFAVNAVGAANVARACAAHGARLVHVSTDYVFAGDSDGPYAADAPVAPRSAYGRTKAAGEWAVRANNPDTLVVRTAWLYGAAGPNFAATMLRLAGERETLSVVDDQHGQPTWTVDLSDLIVRLVDAGAPAGTYHGTSSGETTWCGFAKAVFEGSGLDPQRVEPTTTDKFPRPAPRPARSTLDHGSVRAAGVEPIRDWREGLTEALPSLG